MFMSIVNKLFGRKSPSNPRLEKAMRELARGEDPAKRREVYQELLKSTLILSTPRPLEGKANQHKSGEKLALRFHSLQNAGKKPGMLAFTSEEALLRWKKEGTPYIALGTKDIFSLALKAEMDSIIINPAGPTGGELTLPEIQILSEGAIPQAASQDGATDLEVKAGTRVAVTAPARPPSEKLLQALRQSLSAHPEVQSAYFFDVAIGGGTPHWAVGLVVQGDQAKAQAVFQATGPVAGKHLAPNEFLDFARLEPGPLFSEVNKVVQPFYQKK
jgi:hypothetical protein